MRVPRDLDCTHLVNRRLLPWSSKVSTQPKFSIWMIRKTLRDDSQIRIGYTKKFNIDDWKVWCACPWLLVNWIRLCFSLFLWSRTLTLFVVDSSGFKIKEFLHKMAISLKSGRVKQSNHPSLADLPNQALSSQHLLRFLGIVSDHLCIPVSLPPFQCALWSAFGLPRHPSFSHSTSLCLPYLSPFCSRHNWRRRSLLMRVLSHSDTHYLNRHMARCGCHEILIPRSFYVRFVTRFCHFWWTPYSFSLGRCVANCRIPPESGDPFRKSKWIIILSMKNALI